jgi:preprotein translocase subunit SecB
MTDTPADAAALESSNAVAQPSIRILAQFIRDLSFENPRAPESLRGSSEGPQMELGVELNGRMRADGLYEVDLKISAAARSENDPVFQVEILYGGLFQIDGVPEADIEPVLLIECPRFLFPFVRRIIADITVDGGFPPLLLEPMDFGGIYAARLAQSRAEVVGNA